MGRGTAGASVDTAWVHQLTRGDLEDIFGVSSVERGAAYQRRGTVHQLTVDLDGVLTATVYGTQRYRTSVWWEAFDGDAFDPADVASECSCPVGYACKHGAALLLQAQASWGTADPSAGGTKSWERLLDPVVASVTTGGPESAGSTGAHPLALLVELDAGTAWRGRPAGGRGLRMRPLVRGSSGHWIRTGVSWSSLQHRAAPGRGLDPAHAEALRSLVRAHLAAAPLWTGLGDWVGAGPLGKDLWRLLDDLVAAGVVLVTGQRGQHPVQLLADPVEVEVDVTGGPAAALIVRPTLTVPGASGTPLALGSPPHGVVAAAGQGLVLARLDRPLSAAMGHLLNSVDLLTVPAEDADRFLSGYYPALRRTATVRSSDGSVTLPEVAPPCLGLEVTFEAGHRTRVRWSFRYAVGEQVHDVPLTAVGGDAPVLRDRGQESSLLAGLALLDEVPGLRRPGAGGPVLVSEAVLEGWPTVQLVREVLPVLQSRDDVDVTVVGEPLDYAESTETPLVTVSTNDLPEDGEKGTGPAHGPQQEDWFDLAVSVSLGGRPVPLAGLLTALSHGDRRMILPDGTWFTLDARELHTLRDLVEEARALQDHPSQTLRINRYQAGLWEELAALGVVAEQSERWQRTVGALLDLDDFPRPDVPAGVTAELRDYQLDGYRWVSFLWEHELGGVLADDMGLGKTLQTLAAAERARERGLLSPERPLLVVAPTSVVGTWVSEAARFTPGLRVAAVSQTVRRSGVPLDELVDGAHVVVTSYALLRIDEEHLTDRRWSAVVLDEAQAVKNHQSRTYQAARNLRAPFKLAVTGTPLENSLMDLWSLLSVTAPGLFPSPQRFGQLYRRPIESGQSPELLDRLRRRIRPLMLRRTKEMVAADLPPKIEQVLTVPLNPAHRRIYDTHLQRERQRILGLLDDVDRNRIAILAALTKLRQLSLDVRLVVPDAPVSVRPSKVDALVDQLLEVVAEGHRCLVFSQFTRFLAVVRERLVAEGVGHVYLDGRTRDRPRRIAQFTDGDDPVFLISLKAGGSGLTLTEADYVFVLDPWWNPAVEAQAVDRTHRIGQDRTVMVYRLVAEDTIEEKVVALQDRKRELFSRVVDEGGLMGAPLSAADIRELVGA